jgi:hypothetical protein
MQCTPIAFGEREGPPENAGTPSQVLTPDLGTFYPVGSIAGFYNFDPIKLSQVPAHFAFDIRECTTNSYFPTAVQSVDLEVVITFKIERLGESA